MVQRQPRVAGIRQIIKAIRTVWGRPSVKNSVVRARRSHFANGALFILFCRSIKIIDSSSKNLV